LDITRVHDSAVGRYQSNMREFHGVMRLDTDTFPSLKRQALLFDKIHGYEHRIGKLLSRTRRPLLDHWRDEVDYLVSEGFVALADRDLADEKTIQEEYYKRPKDKETIEQLLAITGWQPKDYDEWLSVPNLVNLTMHSDIITRQMATQLERTNKVETAPICELPMVSSLAGAVPQVKLQSVLQVALKALPVPDDESSWDDILAFKADLHDKQWSFRRWMHSLASKTMTQLEIEEELEWLVKEYRKAMELHHLKASQSFVDVFLISPLEIAEDIAKFRWSKLAKEFLSVRKRQIDLMEAEMKAPGRECAYVFNARKRFGA
jgi:hypothetical protein